MIEPRLAASVRVGALIRQASIDGGFGMVLRKGDEIAGTVLVQTLIKGENPRLWEQVIDLDGVREWIEVSADMANPAQDISAYLDRRSGRDSDLWVIELDVADQQRLTALLGGAG